MNGRSIITATLLLAGILGLAGAARAPKLPPLVAQDGHSFTFGSLLGEPLVVTFVAAHCTDACPLVNAQFEQADQLFVARHMNVRLLTITLDPEHDPPAVMRELAGRFSADPRRWLVASGSVRNVHTVMSAFGVQTARGRDGYADMHTTFVYVFDKDGRLYKTMLASPMLGAQLAQEVRSEWRALEQ